MGKAGKVLASAAAVAAVGAAVSGGATGYFYQRTMKRSKADVERSMKMSGTDWGAYKDMLAERKAYFLDQPHEDAYITSYDGLKLHATYFPRNDEKKVAICFHGYTSQGMSDYIALSDYYMRKNGFSMLLPDARTHGQSEGKYVGFGCLDRWDGIEWIRWIIERCGADVQILLHGTSMGGATVLMMSGQELPVQVKGIVSDCGFTSPKEVFTHVLHTMYHLPAFPIIPLADAASKRQAGYGMDECNAKREVKKAKVPILFIHGTNDNFVPAYMCDELYEACASPKKKFIVEGAAHAESYYKDTEGYERVLDELLSEIGMGESEFEDDF